jgi:Flp pilus assembly protein TadB
VSAWTFDPPRQQAQSGLGIVPLIAAVAALATPLVQAGASVYEGKQTRKFEKKQAQQDAIEAQKRADEAAREADLSRQASAQRWATAGTFGQRAMPYVVAVGTLGVAAYVISALVKRRKSKKP